MVHEIGSQGGQPIVLTFRPTERRHDNLSSAIRLFVLDYYHRAAMTAKQKR
jgi:predicted DNA-binding ribbon-helix-helix protein